MVLSDAGSLKLKSRLGAPRRLKRAKASLYIRQGRVIFAAAAAAPGLAG